jgi:hypothetical protein
MNAKKTDITLVVDRSGSMASIAEESRNGLRVFLDDQRKVEGECAVSLVLFDQMIERPFTAKPVSEVMSIPLEPRGATALLDAIGSTIEATGARLAAMPEAERPGRVIFVIMTDGYENASRDFDKIKVLDLITRQRETYKWDFVFLGANQDAIATASGIGIAVGHAVSYAASAGGVRSALDMTSKKIATSRIGGQSISAYSPEERVSAMDGQKPPRSSRP